MTFASRTFGTLIAVLGTVGLAVPLGALAAAGGAEYGGTASGGGVQYGAPAGEVGTPALRARSASLLGRTLHFRGSADPGAKVAVQRLDAKRGWETVARATADARGAYLARWLTDHIGVFSMRAVPDGAEVVASSAPEPITVTVFKPARATWYGPGFYGKRTACGQRLTRDLVGVAHRGLPCGTRVALYYEGRTIEAPVVDRGPFTNDADWDLTAAAAERLGFQTTDTIGAVSLRSGSTARRAAG